MRHHSASPVKPSTAEPSSRCGSGRCRPGLPRAGRSPVWEVLAAGLMALFCADPAWAADESAGSSDAGAESQPVAEAEDASFEPIPEFDAPTFSFDTPVGPFEYRLGRGMRFGDTGLVVGGFTAIEFDQEENDTGELELDSINLLVLYEPIPEFAIFSEIEIGDLYTVDTSTWKTDPGARLELERLYAEWRFDDAVKARVGKFQTPVGRWNLVPSEPFVWTAIEPVGVELAFDEYLTGAALHGTVYPGSEQLDYWVYGQATRQIDPESDLDPARYSVGGRMAYGSGSGSWSVGSSFLAVEVKDRWSYLGGLDAQLRKGPLELTSELLFGDGKVDERKLTSVYLQAVLELCPNFYSVTRYEHFNTRGTNDDANVVDVGFAWTPYDVLHLKASYRFSDNRTEEIRRGVSASLSFVF